MAKLAQGWGGGQSRAAQEQLPSWGITRRGHKPHTGLFQSPPSTMPERREQPPGRVERRCGDPARSLASPSGTRLCNPCCLGNRYPSGHRQAASLSVHRGVSGPQLQDPDALAPTAWLPCLLATLRARDPGQRGPPLASATLLGP